MLLGNRKKLQFKSYYTIIKRVILSSKSGVRLSPSEYDDAEQALNVLFALYIRLLKDSGIGYADDTDEKHTTLQRSKQ